MKSKLISDFTDKELADMVRGSIYAQNTRFGYGETDARFLLVLAVPYGRDEQVEGLPDAIEAFARLLQDDDWMERTFRVYDHNASQHFYSASFEDVSHNEEETNPASYGDPGDAGDESEAGVVY